LRLAARDLARELTRPRDAQSALNAIDDTLKHDKDFSPASLRTIRRRIEELRRRRKARSERRYADKDARIICAVTHAVDRWPLADIGFGDIAERVTVPIVVRSALCRTTGGKRRPTICMNCAAA
jgi:hypothetical protein